MIKTTAVWLIVGFAFALLLRQLFPKTVVVDHPVVIHVVHDTVTKVKFKFDSAALAKAIAALKPDTNLAEHHSVTPPETVLVVPPMSGIWQLYVPQKVGDTTYVQGTTVKPLGAGHYALNDWQQTFYTAGPLAGLQLKGDTLRAAFYPPPPPPCTLGCKLKLVGEGAGIGIGLFEGLRIIFGRKP